MGIQGKLEHRGHREPRRTQRTAKGKFHHEALRIFKMGDSRKRPWPPTSGVQPVFSERTSMPFSAVPAFLCALCGISVSSVFRFSIPDVAEPQALNSGW